MTRLAVLKCQASGNDFVLLDHTGGARADYSALAKALCDRRFGVGADGLLVLHPASSPNADVAMHIFNADGTEAEMCGNGIRAVARYMHDRKPDEPVRLAVETQSGIMRTQVLRGGAPPFEVRVAMGPRRTIFTYDAPVSGIFESGPARLVEVDLGNPHTAAFVDTDLDSIDLAAGAREIVARRGGNEVNVEVARESEGAIAMRVFERGVGETPACGTGACAVALAAIALGRARSPVRVKMRGGEVLVEWEGHGSEIYLTGGAELVFDAALDVPDEIVASAARAV